MDGDARSILNMKRRKQLQTGRRFQQRNHGINDARQVLVQKKLQGVQKAKFNRPMQGGRANFNQRNSFNKPQFRQQGNNRNFANLGNNRNFANLNSNRQTNVNNRVSQQNIAGRQNNKRFTQNANKRVQLVRNGALQVTSRNRNQNPQVPKMLNNNRFVSGMSELTVVARNKPPSMFDLDSEMFDEPVDNGDELESMTLEDIPEINTMKDLPVSFLSQKKATSWTAPSSSNSTLLSRLAKTVGSSTMIADTISSPHGYKIQDWKLMVTNLKASVSQSDIAELFGYVGNLKNAELIQPGTAIVVYHSKEDALNAYESYNDRLLDGVPMRCVFPNSPTSTRTPITARLGGKFISSQNASTSRAPSSSFPSRRVAFTVKLP